MEIYLYIVAAILVFGMILPQKGPKRINYIALMTVIHVFVSGLRYEHLTGDLRKYHYNFMVSADFGWFSQEILKGGRNIGFSLLNKAVNLLSGNNFQVLLFVIALAVHLCLAYVIYRYSTAPWMSYLIWNCMTFYIFGFSAIKQSLAMAFVMLSFVGVAERNLKFYLISMLLAGSMHMPSLIFLPTYWLVTQKVDYRMILAYLALGLGLYVFRNQFVAFVRTFYYDDDTVMIHSGEIGSRFIMLLGFTLFSLLLTGLPDRDYEKLFHIMAVATILQLLSGFDNIFTRLTDYYYQFSVLYLPMVFFPERRRPQRLRIRPMFPFNERSLRLFAGVIVLFLLWYYYALCLSVDIANDVDDYLNFRFMWDVK